MVDPRLLRTQFAAQAASFADMFRAAVSDYPVGPYRGEMTSPEASTGGGVQSLQHIRLVPFQVQGPTFVVGNANPPARTAEVRTLGYVDAVSITRFGQPSGLHPAAYQAFLTRAMEFFEISGFRVNLASQPPNLPLQPQRQRSPLVWVAVIVWSLALVAIGGVFAVLAVHKGWLR
jgi:hypothetical protein